MTSVMHVFSITTGVDISPAFGSLSGGTVLTLNGSAVDGVDFSDQSSVAVDIGGIPCDIDTYVRTWLGWSSNYLLPFPSPTGPLHLVSTFLPPHAAGRVLIATTHSHALPERTPVLRRGWTRLL